MRLRHSIIAVLAALAVVTITPAFGATSSTAQGIALSGGSALAPAGIATAKGSIPDPGSACSAVVSVSLSCSSTCIGVKTAYACTATGSGGYGAQWYVFTWTGANPTSGSGDNPNYANTVLTPGGPCQAQVHVSLTDGCSSAGATRTIYDYCDSNCRIAP